MAVIGPVVAALLVSVVPAQVATESAKLLPPGAEQGRAVAISGNTMVVAPGLGGASTIYERMASSWQLVATAGGAKSASIDGDTLAVGNAVYVRVGSSWTLQASIDPVGGATGDYGVSVCVRGDWIVIGCTQFSSGDPGCVYVARRTGTSWAAPVKVVATDFPGHVGTFGRSVAIDGEFLLVGNPNKSESAGAGSGIDQGMVYAFRFVSGQWVQEGKLHSPGLVNMAAFGASITLQGTRACIGAPGYTQPGSSPGAGFVMERVADSWVHEATLALDSSAGTTSLGSSAGMDGDSILLGAAGSQTAGIVEAGQARLFRKFGAQWTPMIQLVASDPASFDNFGAAVGISGGWAVVGSPNDDNVNGTDAGAAYVFEVAQAAATTRLPCTAAAPAGSLTSIGSPPNFGATVQLALNDPTAAAGLPPILTLGTVAISLAPMGGYPCGVVIPGWGTLSGLGNELLIDPQGGSLIYLGPLKFWLGPASPCVFALGVPVDGALSGLDLFAQGAFVVPSITGVQIVLSEGLDLAIGY